MHRQFKVYLKGYGDPPCVNEADIKCGALIHKWDRNRVQTNPFKVMQSHEEGMRVSDGQVVELR